jgi:hypothetical protein
MRHKRIIIWGYKLDTGHTHSFIHYGYYIGAKALGIETYWLDHRDNFDPALFDDALVITEHYAPLRVSPGMPLSMSSTYFIHYLGNRKDNPENPDGASMYRGRVGRFLDFRYNGYGWNDKNYDYVIDKTKAKEISQGSRFEVGTDGYDLFYSIFATDILPHEINLEDACTPKQRKSFFAGTIRNDNAYLFEPFKRALKENNIEFVHNCPWSNPLPPSAIRKEIASSLLPADLRGEVWQKGGYVPCRIFKNISYGALGVSNSLAVHEMFGDDVAYHPDTYQMVYEGLKKAEGIKTIQRAMMYVKEHHTYVNRVQDMIKVADQYV